MVKIAAVRSVFATKYSPKSFAAGGISLEEFTLLVVLVCWGWKHPSHSPSLAMLSASAVRIVFFHFESNRIVFAVLKSRDVKFVFFLNTNFSC